MTQRRQRAAAQEDEANQPAFRRTLDTPGAPKAVGRRAQKSELPKESIPGDNTVLADMSATQGPNAFRIGLYVKHESTDTVLQRLGLRFKNALERADCVQRALEMDGHERGYERLGDTGDVPETVGITWAGNRSQWPFPNVPAMRGLFFHWELVEAGCVPARVKSAAEQCEQRMMAAYDGDGNMIPVADRVGS